MAVALNLADYHRYSIKNKSWDPCLDAAGRDKNSGKYPRHIWNSNSSIVYMKCKDGQVKLGLLTNNQIQRGEELGVNYHDKKKVIDYMCPQCKLKSLRKGVRRVSEGST
jgi:hypothetical protein